MKTNFLISSERSGSNLITKILNSHSEICGPSPKHLINPTLRNFFRYNPLENKKNRDEFIQDLSNLINVDFGLWRSKVTITELEQILDDSNIFELLRKIYWKEAVANKKSSVFIKENQIYEYLLYLEQYYPESKFIYLIRDPRDMALSWKESKIHQGGIIHGAYQWKKDQQQTLKYCPYLLDKKKLILIRYEDLISHPEGILKAICEFLGVSYESNLLNFHKNDSTIKNAQKNLPWRNLSKPLLQRNSGKYKSSLKEYDIKIIEKICQYEMIHFGYETNFSKEELKQISDRKVLEEKNIELETEPRILTPSVEENMKAKKVFYTKNKSVFFKGLTKIK